ncbi:MAG: gluconokinase [Planctomycetota bacterium]
MNEELPAIFCYTAWVVMGVSGCGKSTVGRSFAESEGLIFADADDFHPPANVAKMRRGEPLTDADRRPWLDELGRWLADHRLGVLACSALKADYRKTLTQHRPGLRFVHLAADYDAISKRMESREHFMPVKLLRSQFDTLEPPPPDQALILDATLPIDQLVAAMTSDARR